MPNHRSILPYSPPPATGLCNSPNTRIKINSTECLKWSLQSRVQKTAVPQSVTSSVLPDQLLMQNQNLGVAENYHLASSLYASAFCFMNFSEMAISTSSSMVSLLSNDEKSKTTYFGALFLKSLPGRTCQPFLLPGRNCG